MEIDFSKYVGAKEIVLSGRPKGEELRKRLDLNKLDQGTPPITIMIPPRVVSLNSSFFLGLFADSIRNLGESGFRSKYSFNCSPILQNDVDAGIRQALNTSNPLMPDRG